MDHVQQVFRRHVASRRRGERATADAATACVKRSDAFLDGRIGVCHRRVAGIVKMAAQVQSGFKGPDAPYHGSHVGWPRSADGIRQGNVGITHCSQPLNQGYYLFHRHLTLEGATERGADGDAHVDAGGPDLPGNLPDDSHCLFRGGALVTQVECIRSHHRAVDFVYVAGDGPFETAQVQHQPDERDVISLWQAAHHLFRIRHLRNPFGVDKADRLHAPYPGVDQAIDQFQFVFNAEQYRLALQSVPGADINDFNNIWHDAFSNIRPINNIS